MTLEDSLLEIKGEKSMKWILRIYNSFAEGWGRRKRKNLRFEPLHKRLDQILFEEDKRSDLESANASLRSIWIKIRFAFKKLFARVFVLL
jgi:hypothetical protein